MNQEQSIKRIPRPDLRLNPRKWSGAQNTNIASRFAVIATVTAVIGGISIVFLYPYFNIERFRKIQQYNRAGINSEDTQPAGLPVWRDPFDRKKAA